jgi:FkbM family methyltransferase
MGAVPFAWLLGARDRYARRLESGDGPTKLPLLLRASRFRLVPPSITTYSPPGRPELRFVNADSVVVQSTFWFGMDPGGCSVEGAQIALWEQLCGRASEIVEIGAYVGSLTVPGGRATTAPYKSVEAHPETASVLRKNVELNGLTNVEVVEAAAVGEGELGTVELVLPPDEPFALSTSAAVHPAWANGSGRVVRVAATPVSELVGDADLLKIDVEGLELSLLLALEPFILRRRPTMMIEVLDNNAGLKQWLSEFAPRHSMEILAVTAEGTKPLSARDLPTTNLLRRYGTRDVLVVPH